MKPRRYKGVCSCGLTRFFSSPAPDHGKYKSLHTNTWNTDLGAGYPGTGAAHSFRKGVSSCRFCKCEVGLSRSGKPYVREPGEAEDAKGNQVSACSCGRCVFRRSTHPGALTIGDWYEGEDGRIPVRSCPSCRDELRYTEDAPHVIRSREGPPEESEDSDGPMEFEWFEDDDD